MRSFSSMFAFGSRGASALALALLVSAEASGQGRDHFQSMGELSDTPEVSVDGGPALRVRVVDAQSGDPIDAFRMISGVDVNESLVSASFAKKYKPGHIVNWQSHMIREGRDGELLRPLRRAYNPLAIRVEAAGHIPQRHIWIDKKRGSQTLTFRLERDPGLKGRLLTPTGEPASGGSVAITMIARQPNREGCAFVPLAEDASLRDRWCGGVVVSVDSNGEFLLPTETDPSAYVVAVHESGTCQVPLVEFDPQQPLQLDAWARIEGQVLIGTEFGAGESVLLYNVERLAHPYPGPYTYYYEITSDADGRFVIEHFPPGLGEVALPDYIPESKPELGFSYIPPIPQNAMGRFMAKAKETLAVTIGGEGLGERRSQSDR